MNTKRIAITGARGFIGSQLAKALLEQGHELSILNRKGSLLQMEIAGHPNVSVFEGDISHRDTLEPWIQDCNELYHLAAFAKPWAKNMSVFYDINVQGTLHVLDAALKYGCTELVITSSAGTFGPQVNGKLVREDHDQPLPPFTEYERTKQESLEKSRSYLDKGLNIRYVSPTRVFGPGELSTSNVGTRVILRYVKGTFRFLPGDGHSIGNYAYIHDVVKGHQLAMHHGRPGENYILGGENLSYREFFDKVGLVTNQRKTMFGLPMSLMMGTAYLFERTASLTGKEPLITPPFIKKYAHNWGTDIQKAQMELGYKITPFTDAVKETLTWLNERGQLR